MDLTDSSETSAKLNLTPVKYPKENIKDSEHGENLKSRITTLNFTAYFRKWTLFWENLRHENRTLLKKDRHVYTAKKVYIYKGTVTMNQTANTLLCITLCLMLC
jgi:hypothetical protein